MPLRGDSGCPRTTCSKVVEDPQTRFEVPVLERKRLTFLPQQEVELPEGSDSQVHNHRYIARSQE